MSADVVVALEEQARKFYHGIDNTNHNDFAPSLFSKISFSTPVNYMALKLSVWYCELPAVIRQYILFFSRLDRI